MTALNFRKNLFFGPALHYAVDLRGGPRFELELPTYLSQAGASEGWATDILTREKVNVMESSVPLLGPCGSAAG